MSRNANGSDGGPHLPQARADDIQAELARILASHHFRGSRRCQLLLRRITEQSILGDIPSLKERKLGIEVFGRLADYDTNQDPIVRATAVEIRKRLAQYYLEAGHESGPRIDLAPGSYVAEFRFDLPPAAPFPPPETRLPPWRSNRRSWLWGIGVICLVAVLPATAYLAQSPGWKRSEFDQLWDPVLKAPGPVLVCVGLQAAYNLRSAQAQDVVQGILEPSLLPAAQAHKAIREQDLVLLKDRYVALDDAVCLVRLASLLDAYRKPYRIRAERSTSFADLRDTPAVLIGAFDNQWTLREAGQMRFSFSKDSEHDTGMVRDRLHPENTDWKLTNYWPNWDIPVDYAIVTRMLDTTTDRPVMIAAGLTQYGTIGGGEFLSNRQYFVQAARQFPKGWQKKNLQIVLRVPVVNRVSGRPQILATHVW